MTIQTVNLGAAPSGAGGDTFRSTGTKMNENFTNNAHAASRLVGTQTGNVMEVGAFGLGVKSNQLHNSLAIRPNGFSCFTDVDASDVSNTPPYQIAINSAWLDGSVAAQLLTGLHNSNQFGFRTWILTNGGTWSTYKKIYHSGNTAVDSNGFIKAASPIVKLFAEKIELNDEAQQQNPVFEKVDVGHYLIKNTEGFAQEGWWLEVPTDSNGNRICAVEYQTLENGDLEIKTFKKMLNAEGDIVANLGTPVDISNNANGEPRWIDIRLHSTPKPIVQKVPRTEKQARMIQQMKYAPQLTYITKYEDLYDDHDNAVTINGKIFQKPVVHIQTDQNGTPILTNQPVVNASGETVFELVQAIDAEGNLIFDDVPVLDAKGNQIFDEVIHESQQ